MDKVFVPGMRVEIRDEQWIVKKVESNSQGSKTLYVQGISRMVMDREAIFLSNIDKIRVIKPEETELVIDKSSYFIKSRLYMENKLRRKVPTDENLYVGHKAAMDSMPYQLEPSILSLQKPRQRILIADAVGLGKTLEAGILMSELIARGKGKRILVVTVKSMMTQFQKEMWNRFSIPLKRLDSQEIQKVRRKIPSNHNPFYYYDKTIVSIDTIKRDIEYRTYIENARWDIIVIDEAHNVARRGSSEAQRARLAELLSKRSDSLIMLSATPHDGRPKSFASLMNMLDPTAIADEENYEKEDIQGLCVRRFKKDIMDQVEGNFKERNIYVEKEQASPEEEDAYEYFTDMEFKAIDQRKGGGRLFKTILEKSMFSSPAACIKAVENRIAKLEKQEGEDYTYDANILREFKNKLSKIGSGKFSRYKKILNLLEDKEYKWNKKAKDDRIVIFTERIETMKFVRAQLEKDLKLKAGEVVEFHGGMSDIDQQKVVEDFGKEDSKVKIMVASDVASEGINLHYFSHRLIHFDIPWSLMVFQQRNGRVDRYGQEKTPDIRYLVTDARNEKIKGDTRFLEILIEKEKQAEKNIGDPAALLNLHDQELEEEVVVKAIEEDESEDFFGSFFSEDEGEDIATDMSEGAISQDEIKNKTKEMTSIFNGDLEYLKDTITIINEKSELRSELSEDRNNISLEINEEIKRRLKDVVPKEAMPEDGWLNLTTCRDKMNEEIKESRKRTKNTWAKYQYLWRSHPLLELVNDKNDLLFGRQKAPLLESGDLASDEAIILMGGLIPNKRALPMIDSWFGIKFKEDKLVDIIPFEDIIGKFDSKKREANTGKLSVERAQEIRQLIPQGVVKMEELLSKEWQEFEDKMNPKLQEELDKLEVLRGKHKHQLTLFEENKSISRSKKEEKERRIDEMFDEFYDWINDSMILEKDNPYVHIVAAVSGV